MGFEVVKDQPPVATQLKQVRGFAAARKARYQDNIYGRGRREIALAHVFGNRPLDDLGQVELLERFHKYLRTTPCLSF
jgi:hypothetical protein